MSGVRRRWLKPSFRGSGRRRQQPHDSGGPSELRYRLTATKANLYSSPNHLAAHYNLGWTLQPAGVCVKWNERICISLARNQAKKANESRGDKEVKARTDAQGMRSSGS
ncbi:hypothetical protein HanRHA438_Chr17g0832281 [Helianthus annuus]|nr:hypothetical protein HanRHA438_Chr17g0832281 [Helianthus annuus]